MVMKESKITYGEYEDFKGRKITRVTKVGSGQIICLFDKTPIPKEPDDIVCPHFMELKWANGCNFNCAWCFLQGTYRFHPEWKNGKPNIKDFGLVENHVRAFLNNGSRPEILNTGELSDSLLCENGDKSFSKFIVPLFNSQRKHKVLFLTKSTYVKNLLELKMPEQVITSFSLNAIPAARRWEKAPPVTERIKAAKELYKAGYEVRVRIDPMVPIENWEKHYAQLVDLIFTAFEPERITLGSLRGLTTTIMYAKDKSWVKYLSESSGWGKKIDFNTRYKMYSAVINYLNKNYHYNRVALCKETVNIWEALGLNYKNIKCNCIS